MNGPRLALQGRVSTMVLSGHAASHEHVRDAPGDRPPVGGAAGVVVYWACIDHGGCAKERGWPVLIDCDVHQNFDSLEELLPYLPRAHRDHLTRGGYSGVGLPTYLWMHPEGFTRRDAVPDDGGMAGTDYGTMKRQLLDAYDEEFAILNGEEILSASVMAHVPLATALTRAYNEWVAERWLPLDRRFRASIAVATQDAEAAAAEIRRAGRDSRFIQVILPTGSRLPYGDPHYHPIYEAACEMDLPVAFHPGGDGLGIASPSAAGGIPTFYIEWHTLLCQPPMTHLVSLICQGVFETFPALRIVLMEGGVAWLPGLLWRLETNYKALRMEVPWVKRLPSEYVRERVRFTTQPMDQPPEPGHLRPILEMIGGKEMFLFASDYPHWDFDEPTLTLRTLPKEWRDNVAFANARQLYGLPAAESAGVGAPA